VAPLEPAQRAGASLVRRLLGAPLSELTVLVLGVTGSPCASSINCARSRIDGLALEQGARQ